MNPTARTVAGLQDPCTFKTYLTHVCLDICLLFSRKLHLPSYLNDTGVTYPTCQDPK